MSEGWSYFLDFKNQMFELEDGERTVGRSRTCDVSVNDPSVSRRHVVLKADSGRILLKDLGSSNGTFINGERIQKGGELHHGDSLGLGDADLKVRVIGASAFETMRMPAQPVEQHGEATLFLQKASADLAQDALELELDAGPSHMAPPAPVPPDPSAPPSAAGFAAPPAPGPTAPWATPQAPRPAASPTQEVTSESKRYTGPGAAGPAPAEPPAAEPGPPAHAPAPAPAPAPPGPSAHAPPGPPAQPAGARQAVPQPAAQRPTPPAGVAFDPPAPTPQPAPARQAAPVPAAPRATPRPPSVPAPPASATPAPTPPAPAPPVSATPAPAPRTPEPPAPATPAAPSPAAGPRSPADVRLDQTTGDLLPSLDGFDVTMGPEMLAALPVKEEQQPTATTAAYNPYSAPAPQGQTSGAGFGIRLAAALVDGVWIAALLAGAMFASLGFSDVTVSSMASGAGLIVVLFGWAIWGTTPGKRLFNLYVTTGDSNQAGIGFPRALARIVGYLVSSLTLGIGFLMIAVSKSKRGLHDMIAGTQVRRQ